MADLLFKELEEDDFRKIFAFMPTVEKVDFRFAGQMKDSVLEYITARPCHIKYLCLDACNLISDERWFKFFAKWGSQLEVLKLSNLDCSMGDETVAHMVEHCPNLRSLKMKECWKMGDESLKSIAKLEKLEHLSLCLVQQVEEETIVELIQRVGPKLRTLSLERGFKSASDTVLETIHEKCSKLSKLRFCDNIVCTDKGFTSLFTEWRNPGLTFIDVSGTRDLDNANPDGPEDPIGLASEGFKALMAHSGNTIQHLNISSCRHVSFDAFSEVFAPDKMKYPRLKELDISFHTRVDDFLVGTIFKCCPALTKLIAFACFGVRDAQAPPGVALIGGLNAHKSITQEEAA
jgi:DNA repair protein RAD7